MSKQAPAFRAMNATKGGLLLSVTGNKTRSFGQSDAQIGEEEAKEAGFSSKHALQQRLTFSYLLNGKTQANEKSHEGSIAYESAKADVTRTELPSVTYHLPTVEELKGFNLSPLEATALVSSTASRVLNAPDITVNRAFAKAGVPGKNAMEQLLRSAISGQFADKGIAA